MYKLQGNSIKRLSDGANIPLADGNMDYEEYKQWLAEGNIPEPEFTEAELLNNAKELKRQSIRTAFEVESNTPVMVGTVSYHGGFESAMKLDAARRLSEAAGMTEAVFFDTSNIPHTLTLAEAQSVVTTIGAKYQSDFGKKQSLMVAVDSAITIQEVEII